MRTTIKSQRRGRRRRRQRRWAEVSTRETTSDRRRPRPRPFGRAPSGSQSPALERRGGGLRPLLTPGYPRRGAFHRRPRNRGRPHLHGGHRPVPFQGLFRVPLPACRLGARRPTAGAGGIGPRLAVGSAGHGWATLISRCLDACCCRRIPPAALSSRFAIVSLGQSRGVVEWVARQRSRVKLPGEQRELLCRRLHLLSNGG